jgi:hypothetical protein
MAKLLSTFGIIMFIFPTINQVPIGLLGYRKDEKHTRKQWQLNGHTFKLGHYFCFI